MISAQSVNLPKIRTVGNCVMPLVRLLAEGDLSWSDRELIAKAIEATVRQFTAIEKEQQYPAQQPRVAGQEQQNQLNPGYNYNPQRGDNQ